VYRVRREEDARRAGKIRLKSGDSETHSGEEQRSGHVQQHVAHVEPQRLQPRHLVVGSVNRNSVFMSLRMFHDLPLCGRPDQSREQIPFPKSSVC